MVSRNSPSNTWFGPPIEVRILKKQSSHPIRADLHNLWSWGIGLLLKSPEHCDLACGDEVEVFAEVPHAGETVLVSGTIWRRGSGEMSCYVSVQLNGRACEGGVQREALIDQFNRHWDW